VTFEVWADDRKVYDSGLMTCADDARAVDADVTGASTLRLVVGNYDGSKDSDHADRGDARITCGGAA
jgi:alpha-galactosidase